MSDCGFDSDHVVHMMLPADQNTISIQKKMCRLVRLLGVITIVPSGLGKWILE